MPDSKHFIPRINPRKNRILTAFAGLLALAAVMLYESGLFLQKNPAGSDPEAEITIHIKPVDSSFAEHRKTDPTYPLPSYIAKQMPEGEYRHVKRTLIEQTMEAIRLDDRKALGSGLALLGAAALNGNDLPASRVYLEEALEVYEDQDDIMGIGSVELLRSRVETVARENARDAAGANEVMHIAAWMVIKDRFAESEYPIQTAIEENLRLDRYAAAAAGYEMLERGYRSVGNTLAANDAATEALRLHASSGRVDLAQETLKRLNAHALPLEDQQQLEQEIGSLERNYLQSLQEVARARDYEYLYRRLITAGDPVQAWTFRQKANQSLTLASKRAMNRRQTGIVALLYNSNDNQRDASRSLERARDMFNQAARPDLLEYIESAQEKIW